jgi:hypothetical protein
MGSGSAEQAQVRAQLGSPVHARSKDLVHHGNGRRRLRETSLTSEIAIDASFLPGELHADPRVRRFIAYGRDGHVQVIPC